MLGTRTRIKAVRSSESFDLLKELNLLKPLLIGQGVLLDWYVALVAREDLPAVFLLLIIKAEENTSVVRVPDSDDIVSVEIVDGPIHKLISKNTQEKSRC